MQRAAGAVAEEATGDHLQLVHQVGNFGTRSGVPTGADARSDVVDGRGLVGQVAAAVIGDGVDLLAFLLGGRDVAEGFEHLQGGGDGTRAGSIATAHAVLEGADDVVAGARGGRGGGGGGGGP